MQQVISVYSHFKPSFVFLGILFILQTTVFSQTMLKWGDIPADHLAMEACPFEEDAKALILADIGNVEFKYDNNGRLHALLHRHKRVKIFDKSASDQGDIKIKYYHKYTLVDLKAQVIDADGKVTELSEKQIFDERVNRYYKSKNFALPNVQPGSILEFQYTLDSPYISELFEWYFQDDIPLMHSELAVQIFQLVKYTPKTDISRSRTSFNIAPKISYMSDWEEINKELMESESVGGKLRFKKKKINNLYLSSVQGVEQMSDKEKLESIYNFVQSKMTWNKYIGITSTNNLDQVLESGTGTAQEINMILAILLNANEIESNLVLMPTRTSGKPLETYPFLDQFDYAITSAKINEKLIFLDASGDMNPIGIMPVRALNSRGFMISKEIGKWVDVPIKQDKEVTYFKGEINTDGSVTGTWSKRLNAYSGAEAKMKYSLQGEKYITTNLKDKFGDLEISNAKLEGLMEESKNVKYSTDIIIPEACTVSNDYLYLKPVMHTSYSENPFRMEERKYPIDMPYPFVEQFILSLKIPEGLEVEEMPEELKIALPNGDGAFTYTAKVMNENIMIDSKLNFKKRSYNSEEYQAVKALFEKVVSKNTGL